MRHVGLLVVSLGCSTTDEPRTVESVHRCAPAGSSATCSASRSGGAQRETLEATLTSSCEPLESRWYRGDVQRLGRTMQYDALGRLIVEDTDSSGSDRDDGADGVADYGREIEHGSTEVIERHVERPSDGTGEVVRYALDAEDRVIRKVHEDRDGQLVGSTELVLGPGGRIEADTTVGRFPETGMWFTSTRTFAYDDDGRVVSRTQRYDDGPPEVTELSYDRVGDLERVTVLDYRYSYRFDRHGRAVFAAGDADADGFDDWETEVRYATDGSARVLASRGGVVETLDFSAGCGYVMEVPERPTSSGRPRGAWNPFGTSPGHPYH